MSRTRRWEAVVGTNVVTTEWAQEEEARRFTMCVSRQCETCKACVLPPGYTLGSLIPPSRPESWSVLRWISFGYPWCCPVGNVSTVWLCVCVDRHSGWIMAVPCLNKGFTGAFVAQKMLKWQWRPLEFRRSSKVTKPVCLWVHGSKICVQVWAFGKHFLRPITTRQMVGQNALVNH